MALQAWYPFNGDTLDYSGNENHGTGTVTFIDNGKIGKAVDCNSGVVNISLTDSIKKVFSGDKFTMAMWMKQTGTPVDWNDIIKYHDINNVERRLEIAYSSNNPGKTTYWNNRQRKIKGSCNRNWTFRGNCISKKESCAIRKWESKSYEKEYQT